MNCAGREAQRSRRTTPTAAIIHLQLRSQFTAARQLDSANREYAHYLGIARDSTLRMIAMHMTMQHKLWLEKFHQRDESLKADMSPVIAIVNPEGW
jgi:hypothetical protein